MTRILFLAALTLISAGCRHSCTSKSALPAAPACNSCGTAMPVSYGAPVNAYPASYSTPINTPMVAMPASGFPSIPSPPSNATELPYPTETIPPTMLPSAPVSGLPSGIRSVAMPK